MAVDVRQVAREVEGCRISQRRFVDWLEEQSPIASERPSRLPEWSIGHVLTHLSHNADSYVNLLPRILPQYDSVEDRNSAIEAGSNRIWNDLIDDVRSSCERVDAELSLRLATLQHGRARQLARWRSCPEVSVAVAEMAGG